MIYFMKKFIALSLLFTIKIFAQSHQDSIPSISLPDTTVKTSPEGISDSPFKTVDFPGLYYRCRSSFINHEYPNSFIHWGYIGKFRGKKIFFETWHMIEASDGSANYLLLRTDTSKIDSIDICVINYNDKDTIMLRSIDSNGVFHFDSTLMQKDFPSLLQVLIYSDDVPQNYAGLNVVNDQRIYFRRDKLFIQHWKRYQTGAELVLDSYKYDSNRFRFQKSKLLKEVDYYAK
jgi:hypothetical protein